MNSAVHGILQAWTLERVAFPFSRGSSPPTDQTQVSCTAGRFFTIWEDSTIREALWYCGYFSWSPYTLVIHTEMFIYYDYDIYNLLQNNSVGAAGKVSVSIDEARL